MKIFCLIVFLIVGVFDAFGQIVCTAPDSVINLYRSDAERMALRKIYRLNLPYEDSIEIPQIYTDSFLNPLLAVYNATHLPARDTVIDFLNIHTRPTYLTDRVLLAVDSTVWWMQQLRNNIIPTGYTPLDSLMDLYDLSVYDYETYYGWFFWHSVVLRSTRNLNIPPLANAFETLPEVDFAEPRPVIGDGDNISDDYVYISDPDPWDFHVNLFYSYGWGDCPSGCIYERVWWFKIYEGCHVELEDVFGSALPFTATHDEPLTNLSIWPNPFKDHIRIEGIEGNLQYSIYSLEGKPVASGSTTDATIHGLEGLFPGGYFLIVNTDSQGRAFRIIRN